MRPFPVWKGNFTLHSRKSLTRERPRALCARWAFVKFLSSYSNISVEGSHYGRRARAGRILAPRLAPREAPPIASLLCGSSCPRRLLLLSHLRLQTKDRVPPLVHPNFSCSSSIYHRVRLVYELQKDLHIILTFVFVDSRFSSGGSMVILALHIDIPGFQQRPRFHYLLAP